MNQVPAISLNFSTARRKTSKECTCEIIPSPRSKDGFVESLCDVCSEKYLNSCLVKSESSQNSDE